MRTRRFFPGLGSLLAALVLCACPKAEPAARRPSAPPPPTREPEAPPPVPRRVDPPPLTAADVVDRAMQAAGGAAKLEAALSRMELTTQGTYHGAPYSATVYFQAPHRHVMVIDSMKMEWGTSETDCWQRLNGVVLDCAAQTREVMQKSRVVGRFAALYPLKATDVTLRLTHLRSDAELRSHLIAVKQGAVEAVLHIDRKTYRLTFLSYQGRFSSGGPVGEIGIQQGAFRTQDGVTFPTEITMSFAGQVVVKETVLTAKLGQVDATKLDRPAQPPFGVPQALDVPAHHAAFAVVTAPAKNLRERIEAAVKELYDWATAQGLKVTAPLPAVYYLSERRQQVTVEVRFAVAAPAQAVAGTKPRGVKAVPAQKVRWALEQGPFERTPVWLKALRAKLVRQRLRVLGPGGMQPLTDPRQVTDPTKTLASVFFAVK